MAAVARLRRTLGRLKLLAKTERVARGAGGAPAGDEDAPAPAPAPVQTLTLELWEADAITTKIRRAFSGLPLDGRGRAAREDVLRVLRSATGQVDQLLTAEGLASMARAATGVTPRAGEGVLSKITETAVHSREFLAKATARLGSLRQQRITFPEFVRLLGGGGG